MVKMAVTVVFRTLTIRSCRPRKFANDTRPCCVTGFVPRASTSLLGSSFDIFPAPSASLAQGAVNDFGNLASEPPPFKLGDILEQRARGLRVRFALTAPMR